MLTDLGSNRESLFLKLFSSVFEVWYTVNILVPYITFEDFDEIYYELRLIKRISEQNEIAPQSFIACKTLFHFNFLQFEAKIAFYCTAKSVSICWSPKNLFSVRPDFNLNDRVGSTVTGRYSVFKKKS